jgi:hypothetical protein
MSKQTQTQIYEQIFYYISLMVIIQNNIGIIFHYMQSINVFAPFIVIASQGVASNNFNWNGWNRATCLFDQ